ncbi:GLPGLI family protein [Flavobacterium ardleyense]|uniref:GLPGLI family protein n=1 Tax=Flavobacterium ardleyense TaxID=2038737 RepID=A0ABW5ZAP0_9FLAO
MKYIIAIVLMSSFYSFSQIKNGVVTYGVQKNLIEEFKNKEYLSEFDREATEVAPSIVFNLFFNKAEVGFSVKEITLPENQTVTDMTYLIGFTEKIYENKKKKIYRTYSNSSRIGEVVNVDSLQYKWTITSETKEINGYNCYKATTPQFGDNGAIASKYDITAWFTPKIPVPYGPNGYGNLPGLILELQSFYSVLYVKTIDLNLKEDPKIDKLENYPQLTEDEIIKYMTSTLTPEQKKAVMDSKRIK